MYGYIDGYDFGEMEPMRYYAPPASWSEQKKKDHARRMRIKEQMVDSDITIERLFERDNGKCALCGGQCDWNDYTRKNNTV